MFFVSLVIGRRKSAKEIKRLMKKHVFGIEGNIELFQLPIEKPKNAGQRIKTENDDSRF